MTITALMDPSQLPDQSQDQNTFDGNFANYFANLVLRGKQENDLAANLNSVAAGGAYALPFKIQGSAATVGGPAGGNFCVIGNGTGILIDTKDARGIWAGGVFSSTTATSSGVKGAVRIVKQGDPSVWSLYNLTSAYSQDSGGLFGYFEIAYVSSSGTFNPDDAVMLYFQRTGDKGDTGATGSISLSVFHAREEQSQGTGGAAGVNISTGVERRVLNTVKNNDISGASLASNQVSLPAGKYRMRARASLDLSGSTNFVGHHKAAIYNVTDGAYAIIGHSNDMAGPGSTIAWGAASQAEGVVTIAGTKVFEVRSIHSDSIYAWGSPVGVSQVEVYTEIIIEKIG